MNLFVRRMIVLSLIAVFLAYSIFWIIYVPFSLVVWVQAGWKAASEFSGLSGDGGQILLLLALFANPLTVLCLSSKLILGFIIRQSGAANAQL